jgi:hypothetical protein
MRTGSHPYSQGPLRRFAARFGLCALLLQALFPALLASALHTAPAQAWDTVVLCTSDGLKTVSLAALEAEQQGEKEPPAQNAPHAPYCPACPGYFQVNAAITPAILLAAKPSFGEIDRILPSDDRGPDGRRFVPQSARAPPLLA